MSQTILIGDALAFCKTLEPQYHAVITSPPYWGKLDYGHGWNQLGLERTPEVYLLRLGRYLRATSDLLVPGGAMVVNLGDTWNNYSAIRRNLRETKGKTLEHRRALVPGHPEKALLPLAHYLPRYLNKMILRDFWVWEKPTGRPVRSDRPPSNLEWLVYLRKPSGGRRYREAYWDDHLGSRVLRYNPISDPGHPCPMPSRLAQDLILSLVPEGGWVLDPFCGLGTVPKVADTLGRHGTGIDLVDYRV
jgi:DNA modification methylase